MTDWNITASGITYASPAEAPSKLYWVDPKQQENFWCPVTGGTSGSSSSPRTELREVTAEGKPYNFLSNVGQHIMRGAVRGELAPSSKKVIIAQIHAHGASNPFLMVSWWNDEMRIDARPAPDANTTTLARIKCTAGQVGKFTLAVMDGILSVNLSNISKVVPIDPSWDQFPFYFKRGAYVIDHEGPETEGGWIVYESSSVEHNS